MHNINQVRSQFQQELNKSLDVCQFIERGQAETPLTDLFSRLDNEITGAPFSVTLLGLTPEARTAALKWLYGHNFSVFSLEVSNQIGLLEVRLKDKGFTLEQSTGDRLEFDQWEQLVAAISDAGLLKMDANVESAQKNKPDLRLVTETGTGVKSLHLLMPESTDFISQSPALLTRLLRETNVLMVAAPPNYQLDKQERDVLGSLLEDMAGFWPLLPVDELDADLTIPSSGWWQLPSPVVSLPPQLLTTHVSAALPEFLTDPLDPMRQTLKLLLGSQKNRSATEAIQDRYQQELRQLNSRKKREARKNQASAGQGNNSHSLASQLRTTLADQLAKIPKALQAVSRKRELVNSTGSVDLKQLVDSLSVDDLHKEDAYKLIKLTLGENYKNDLMTFLRNNIKQTLTDDLVEIQRGLTEAQQATLEQLEATLGYRPLLTIPSLDEKHLLDDLQDSSGVELRYQGEMPKRGFFDRLSEGRRSAFVILMAASMLGYMGIDMRNSGLMGFVLLPMFIGAIVYTYFSWQKEDAQRFEKEITKVRDEVLSSARRLLSETDRHKQAQLNDHIDATKKQWSQQVDDLLKDWQARQQADTQQQAHKARSRIQVIEQQLTDWQRYHAPIQQLQRGADELIASAERELKQLAASS
mgnify:FL=1